MTTNCALRTIALTGALLWPLGSAAQEAGPPAAAASAADDPTSLSPNAVEFGAGFQNTDSFRFGKYTGLVDKGAIGVGTVVIRGRDAWDSGKTRYWELLGTNLGLTSREVTARYGNQGLWSAAFLYSQMPFYQSDSSVSIFGNAGGTTLTLPAGVPT